MNEKTPAVWLTLHAHDAAALIDELVGSFGFVVTARFEADGKIQHAELRWPEGPGGVMLGSHRPEGPWVQEPGTGGGYVVTADPDALHQRAAAAGTTIIQPPQDRPHGSREFLARDREGNLWSFGTYRGEPLP